MYHFMKKSFCIKFLTVGLIFTLQAEFCDAQFVNEDKAKTVAINFFNNNHNTIKLTDAQLVYTERLSDATHAWYAFNMNTEGYVIVSADERLYPILAYSDCSLFFVDALESSTSFSYWMQARTNEIEHGLKLNPPQTNENALRWSQLLTNSFDVSESKNGSVDPLLTSSWGQDCYYNEMCPIDEATPSNNCGHALVGCTATALSQIMYYWKHPLTGNGSITFTSSNYGSISVDFGSTTYDWAEMEDAISSSNLAVAELLFHVGASIESIYGPTGTAGRPWLIDDALINFFGYSDEMEERVRSSYSDEDWTNMLKSSLDLGQPIYFSGRDTIQSSSHAFVIDGYDENDYFHVNWGWEGLYNGYFYIDDLTPTYLDYTANQTGIFNIYPNNSSVADNSTADFNIYPVPLRNKMLIKSFIEGDAIISIIDINGKNCLSEKKEFNNQSSVSVDVSNLNSGVYLVTISYAEKTYKKKIVKQ